MVKGTQASVFNSGKLGSAMAKLAGLSQEPQSAVAAIIERLSLPEAYRPEKKTEEKKKGGTIKQGKAKGAAEQPTD